MLIQQVKGKSPEWGQDCFIAENATLTGDVVLGDRCSVWYTAVIRGDVNRIRIGNEVNIQDGAVIHGSLGGQDTRLGNGVLVGHRAIVHGCTVADNVLIGMGSIIMDNCHIGENSIIAAGAVLTQGTIVPPNSLYAGVPARFIKHTTPEQIAMIKKNAENYTIYPQWLR